MNKQLTHLMKKYNADFLFNQAINHRGFLLFASTQNRNVFIYLFGVLCHSIEKL